MTDGLWRGVLLVVAAIVVLATGFLLARSGRPYGSGLLTVHKLIDLAALVFVGFIVVTALRAGGGSSLDWVLVIATAVVALATLGTGGALSASETMPTWIALAHRWLPWPLVLLLGLTAYRMASRG